MCMRVYTYVCVCLTVRVSVCIYTVYMVAFLLGLTPSSFRGLFTSDLTHLDDGNNNFTHDKLINFTKCVLIYNRIRDFMLYQVCAYVWCVCVHKCVWCACVCVRACGVHVCACVCVFVCMCMYVCVCSVCVYVSV